MQKASKSGLCHPQTNHFNRLHRLPKRVNGRREAAVRAEILWQAGNSFADAIGFFSTVKWRAALPQGPLECLCLVLETAVLLDSVTKNRQQTCIGRAEIPRA
ncbi:hypothetical protein [Mesorhizobium erdmanii]|uniref:Uncharacterized protein n=1 Tax=Mesorhizobium erdmanii TaxID=1777866 RepID=A0A6M7UFX0_9HYPH|nr:MULTISPECIES: hypothetical protein [Mesorhizobium]OBQ70074.1 hypothetical protein A8146_28070 [Mesorhizobium loti]QKC76151.1 hypothetical protein EB233_11865 [Mesorhizobium erdmanii]